MSDKEIDYQRVLETVSGVFDKQLFFIIGLTRSGTVWLQKAIDAHWQVSCRGEGHFADVMFPQMANAVAAYNKNMSKRRKQLEAAGLGSTAGVRAGLTNNDVSVLLATAMALTLSRWSGDKKVKCIGERTSEYSRVLKDLKHVLPNAKIVNVIRDGRDEAVSVYDYNIRIDASGFLSRFEDFAAFAGHFASNWTRDVGDARYFGRANPDNYIEIRSEELHTDAEPEMARLFRFLSIDDGDAAIDTCVEAGRRATLPDGVIGQWRDRFDDAAAASFLRQSGELLKLLDYEG
ncbi:MAG: sulfotransferase family protein [Alphaproteobacteria bacterium]